MFSRLADRCWPSPLVLLVVLLGLCAGWVTGAAADGPTGLPVPRFATLKSNEVNLRTGPGVRYPVEWVFSRKNLPVEVTAEFENWRRIRDIDGAEGWVHQTMLSGKRSVIALDKLRGLKRSPTTEAELVAQIEAGAIGALHECARDWCRVEFEGHKGWLRKTDVWGVYQKS
jgi:SH3-like domain-containing protein